MTVITDQVTLSCSTSALSLHHRQRRVPDDTNVFIAIDKTCSLPVQESASYNFSGHF
jgi:hypothetical protein